MNTSIVNNDSTARTNRNSAEQRAFNLSKYGINTVLELCIGPSLRILEECYSKYGISIVGNDIDVRWRDYYPIGNWIIGDCFDIDYSSFDCVVFAPPLSRGCTGRREDSLLIDEIYPKYTDFISKAEQYNILKVMVLPARSLVPGTDTRQLYKLLSNLMSYEMVILTEGRRNIRKYVDIYF